jgi:hypothetical protein
MPKKIIS